ncbi:MAG TPA: DUF4127 family protein, partial [Acholeplasmataceae bacterium]|nr:DUF4127 family protein [Acholeplasmataceae bacterium]
TIGYEYSDKENSDFVLSIYTEKENVDLDLSSTKEVLPKMDEVFDNYINELNELIKEKNVCFVDLLFPNGGSTDILKLINYEKLMSYSAWNTASNSLGSALAHIASIIVSKHKGLNNLHLSNNFKNERILDDAIYQYEVRREVSERLLKEDINIYNLGKHYKGVLEEVKRLMVDRAKEFMNIEFSLDLPWKRTFEAEIIIKGD